MTRIIGVIVCALVIAGSAATSAQADNIGSPGTYCGSTYLCVWYDAHYGGNRYSFGGNNASWHTWAIADDDSSSYNNGTSGSAVGIYVNTNYEGQRIVCLPRGSWASHHSPNDEGSSNRWLSSC